MEGKRVREKEREREGKREESHVLVIREGAAVLELLAGEDQPLLAARHALVVGDALRNRNASLNFA